MKQLQFMLAIMSFLAALYKDIMGMGDIARYGGTPSIPHSKRHHRHRAHAPNDGRWHMKFHR